MRTDVPWLLTTSLRPDPQVPQHFFVDRPADDSKGHLLRVTSNSVATIQLLLLIVMEPPRRSKQRVAILEALNDVHNVDGICHDKDE